MRKIKIEISEDVFDVLTAYRIHTGFIGLDEVILDAIRDATSAPNAKSCFGNLNEMVSDIIEYREKEPEA